jgi:lipid-binding SYLF domain-containing protein
MIKTRHMLLALGLATASALPLSVATFDRALAASTPEDLNRDSDRALRMLEGSNPAAAAIARQARAVLVFPNIVKAGFVFGGAYGEGELRHGSRIDGYYNSVTGSWGFQAGIQSYGYVVYLMTNRAVSYLHRTQGLEIGVGPTVVIVNQGVAANLSTSTLKDDAYAFIFDQHGLMGGVSIEGTKISPIRR